MFVQIKEGLDQAPRVWSRPLLFAQEVCGNDKGLYGKVINPHV